MAFFLNRVSASPADRAGDTAAHYKRFVGRVHYRICILLRNVAFD